VQKHIVRCIGRARLTLMRIAPVQEAALECIHNSRSASFHQPDALWKTELKLLVSFIALPIWQDYNIENKNL
jgi:hypothetical protein